MSYAMQDGATAPGTFRPVAPAHAGHSRWTKVFHWTSLLAIIVSAAAALWREQTEDQDLRIVLMQVHRQVGLFVLLVWLPRIAARLNAARVDHGHAVSALETWAARLVQLALYGLLFAMPVLGLAVSNAHAVQIKLLGVLPLPSLVAADSDLADQLSDLHVWGAWALLALVLLHAGAACWHHWVRRDAVLLSMLPETGRK